MSVSDTQEKTGLGNYFVANYPPFSAWKPAHLAAAHAALHRRLPARTRRWGCTCTFPFAANAASSATSASTPTRTPATSRPTSTPSSRKSSSTASCRSSAAGRCSSSTSAAALRRISAPASCERLIDRLQAYLPWDQAEEVTFECEPGTLQQHKLETLKELGVTRLSLGVENFGDEILEANGRAHLSAGDLPRLRLGRATCGFDQINIDLIAGMVGETWDNWRDCVRKTIELAPDSVTIYQMELPFNTVFSKELQSGRPGRADPDASSPTGRPSGPGSTTPSTSWPQAGYRASSAYTLVKNKATLQVRLSRQSLARRRHVRHRRRLVRPRQRRARAERRYLGSSTWRMLDQGELPLGRALPVTPRQLLIREMILQLKTGRLDAGYFQRKFGVDIRAKFGTEFAQLQESAMPCSTMAASG